MTMVNKGNRVNSSDFVHCEYNYNSDSKKRVCILKEDILRIWETPGGCKIFLKSKQDKNSEDRYAIVSSNYDSVMSQL